MPRTTRTSAKARGLEPEGVQRRKQDVVVRKMTPSETKKAADLTDRRIQEYQQKLRQLQRLLSGLETNSPDFDFKGNVTRESLLNIMTRDTSYDFTINVAKELAPLIKEDGKPIIDPEPIITKWLEAPPKLLYNLELNQLAQDKQGKARIDALGQLELREEKPAKRKPTETTPVDTTADETETTPVNITADETATPNEAVIGQHSENAPPQPASRTWWDNDESVAVEPRRVGGSEAVSATNMFRWNSAGDIEATIPEAKPTSHLKEGLMTSRKTHRDGLGELSPILSRQLRDGFEPRQHETPPCVGSSAFAKGDMDQSAKPLSVPPESNGYRSHTSPPTSIQPPVLEDSRNPTPVEGPASGASETTDLREKRRLVVSQYTINGTILRAFIEATMALL
ncbi:hypothetical protein Neosp_015157 [[Neocosmospora] mangrovei]